jgi:predicted nucleotidyltransferase
MVRANVGFSKEAIAELCRRHRIRKLSLFGSVLRDDFRPDSDVDMLVEFDAGYSPGWDIIHVEDDFSQLFGGRKVEILNPKYLNHRLKDRVLSDAVLQYEDHRGQG